MTLTIMVNFEKERWSKEMIAKKKSNKKNKLYGWKQALTDTLLTTIHIYNSVKT